MHFQTFPTPRAWKRHTGRAHQVGLSAGALACLGTEPHAHEDPPASPATSALSRSSVAMMPSLPASSPPKRSAPARRRGETGDKFYYILHVPISKQAADELAPAKRVPDIPSPGEGQRTAAYDAIMRPTARARVKANAILQD